MHDLLFPSIYLLAAHIEPDKLPELESQIPSLTYDINEAEIILGKISKKARAIWELRRKELVTTEISVATDKAFINTSPAEKLSDVSLLVHVDGSGTASDSQGNSVLGADSDNVGHARQLPSKGTQKRNLRSSESNTPDHPVQKAGDIIKVVKLAWFLESISKGVVLPVDNYLIYQGRKELQPNRTSGPQRSKTNDILKRARDNSDSFPSSQDRVFSHGTAASGKRQKTSVPPSRPRLLQETTSEHEIDQYLPPIPDFLHTTYSCQRPTPFNPPNSALIEELKKIKTLRELEGDGVGVRAYSTVIATLCAYPHLLTRAQEVSRLPGCGPKIAELYREWHNNGFLQEVENANNDPRLLVLKVFYEIWGVAGTTAREFYNKGWRDLDDVVEYNWESLSRVQQIGVKYYDEFLSKIPRTEVEYIASIILAQANKIQQGFQMVIVGGFRRGKQASGDVDVVLSHPSLAATHDFINKLVMSLEKDKFITHLLTLSTRNSERGQAPLAWKGEDRKAGTGFDTLDKALVVWQNPQWDQSPASKNANPHRRVDIIISPWQTAGCAVIGWSGGTTFERDLRRYCKKEKSLKFDSSGIRSRTDGQWVDLENGPDGPAPDMLTAEKRVFQGLGLEWRPPEERCTG